MKTTSGNSKNVSNSRSETLLAALTGVFIAVALLKLGNPVVLDHKVVPPQNFEAVLNEAWPSAWGYFGFIPLIFLGLRVGRWKERTPKVILLMPLVWLGWQFVSATHTVSPSLTAATLKHFSACVVCFYLGWFALAEVKNLTPLWLGMVAGFFWVIKVGFEQHFGGLEASRHYFELYILPGLSEPPVDLIKKMSTGRIFSTLFYPNTLAGVILLFLPISLASIWKFTRKLTIHSRCLLVGVFGLSSIACLFWSGSKSGWLLMLALFMGGMFYAPIPKNIKWSLLGGVLALGLVGFFLKYAGFFEKGATSVVARTEYWRAAIQIAKENPVFGTGPGTFSVPFQKIKPPQAEMARLCHNDYLEQASDSGLIGFLAYGWLVLGILWLLYRHRNINSHRIEPALLLGLSAVCAQGVVEFNLYIPALAWPTFLFFGSLLGLVYRNQNGQEGIVPLTSAAAK